MNLNRMAVVGEDESGQIKLVVKKKYSSRRIDKYLVSRLQDFSRSNIQRLIKEEAVKVNSVSVKNSYEIKQNDIISIDLPTENSDHITPEDIPLDIIFEDEYLMVLNKSTDTVVHPSRGHSSGTLVNALAFHCNNLSSFNGPLRPGIVHRLDRDTSGAILVVKDEKVHKHLALQFENREVKKEYLAVVKGETELDSDRIDLPIGKDKRDRKKMAIRHDNGKNAVTIFEARERYPGFTLVKVFLETGRTHQIRVHMKTIGHPVVADAEYGNSEACYFEDLMKPFLNKDVHNLAKNTELCNNVTEPIIMRQALHAYKIGFIHPVTNEALEFTADIPEDMRNLITTLRKIKTLLN
ncbi:pseudouridine synthase [Candidatus Scalindua japonica]|uniref:Pseudouridine synthase n=1 Tax=Candidatus Scalindua japonica TaxID=1284222 RepID=A0A286TYV8_9BACT|nr:RluA family pseudouridine synthase [Candidatus Scalindua japonica]GAX61067.1 pseudouridine synthase [Candidatus Scalindua japonica]